MRTPELVDWINSLSKNPDEIKQKVLAMPKKLKNELLEEALLRNPKLKQGLDKSDDVVPSSVREIDALLQYCKTPEIFKDNFELTLDGWNSGNVPSSNIIDTSSLFAVLTPSSEKERPFFRKEVLFARQNTTIVYTGELLFQFDWDVFHALICLSHGKFDTITSVQPTAILELLGLPRNGRVYDLLEASLDRLSKAFISITRVYPDDKYPTMKIGVPGQSGRKDRDNLTLIDHYSWRRGFVVRYSLDARLTMLFGNFEYGLIDWKTRNMIGKNEMAKKLQCLFAGQKANQQFHKVAKIRELCRVSAGMAHFTSLLEKALTILVEIGAIKAFWIEKPKKGLAEEKILCIWKNTCPSKSGQNPGGRRGKYRDANTPK